MSKCIKVAVASWTAWLFVTALPLSAQNGAGAAQVVPSAADASSKRQGAGLRVGIIDVLKARDQYPRYIKLMNELQGDVEGKQQQLKALKARMDELRATLEILDQDTKDYADKTFELGVGRQREDFLVKQFGAETQARRDEILVLVYRDMEKAIAKVAAQKGVDMVLAHTPPPTVEDDNLLTRRDWNLLARTYEQQQIWFAAEQLDLTVDVIKLMQVPVEDAVKPAGGASPAGKPSGNSRQGD